MAPSATTSATTRPAAEPMSNQAKPLTGKVALITGAGRGIGKGIALELGKRGASIVVNYGRSSSSANEVVSELAKLGSKAVALQADISKPAEVAALFEKAISHFGGVDYVISNSGMEVWCEETEVTADLFDQVFNLNTRGQFFVAQQALKHCREGGRIVLTSSIAAQMAGIPNHALYAGSKAAVEGFTRAFAVDCGKKRMTCNAIAPGGIQTDMFDENAWHYVPGGYKGMPIDSIKAGLRKMCPLDRVGEPADVGKVVYCLISDEGEWINGQVIRASGGGV
ncbi:1,3,6,8-Tetrahydroxynaphthalene reductase in complex with Nadph and Pyroquilon [Hypoxylon fuscum]|nr:1,3,6,8-Tetrahydroxynaphthalene reductase in complex with Nadph and Pyroquilon [Hypoxylon fuscum]